MERYRPCFFRRRVIQCKRLRTWRNVFVRDADTGVGRQTSSEQFEETDERREERLESCASIPALDSHELK